MFIEIEFPDWIKSLTVGEFLAIKIPIVFSDNIVPLCRPSDEEILPQTC